MTVSARALTLEKLFSLGVFEPARVQRDYQWTDKEWGELLGDLEQAFRGAGMDPDPDPAETFGEDEYGGEDSAAAPSTRLRDGDPGAAQRSPPPKDYFLGPMILMPRVQTDKAFLIYDGQQRFTTLSLMLAALRDSLGDNPEDWFDLQQMLRTSDERRLTRLQVSTPGNALRRITGTLRGADSLGHAGSASPADRQMRGAHRFFKENTAGWSNDKRRAFVRYLRENVYVTVTEIENRKLAEIAYQTVNTRGRSLKADDIVKGHVLQVIGAASLTDANKAADDWERLRRSLGVRFELFLRTVDFIRFGKARTNDFGLDLMEVFDGPDGAELAKRWIGQILPRYRDHFLPLIAHERIDPARGADLYFRQLGFLRWREEWNAVAMALTNTHARNEEHFLRDIRRLRNSCYVMHLLGWSNKPERRAYALSNAIEQLDNGESPFRPPVRDRYGPGALWFGNERKAQARGALSAPMPDDDFHGPIVRWLETLYWGDGAPSTPTRYTSVEHVLPRAHGDAWIKAFPNEEERERCKNQLGNFCLLPESVDRSLQNRGFEEKRAEYLKLDEMFRSAKEVAAYADWTPLSVNERTAKLAAKAARELGITANPRAPESP